MGKYLTIQQPSEGAYKEKGSKFLAFAHPVQDESQIKELIKKYRSTYFDARHHCYAYSLGVGSIKFRAAGDGEPSNSAGTPILGQIRSFQLSHVLIIVVRYFGGTKLGIPGLIKAYKSSARDALEKALIIEVEVMATAKLRCSFNQLNKLMGLIKKYDLKILKQEFTPTECLFELQYKEEDRELLLKALEEGTTTLIM